MNIIYVRCASARAKSASERCWGAEQGHPGTIHDRSNNALGSRRDHRDHHRRRTGAHIPVFVDVLPPASGLVHYDGITFSAAVGSFSESILRARRRFRTLSRHYGMSKWAPRQNLSDSFSRTATGMRYCPFSILPSILMG